MKLTTLFTLHISILQMTTPLNGLNEQETPLKISSDEGSSWALNNRSSLYTLNEDEASSREKRVPSFQYNYNYPPECFSKEGPSPYLCNLKGTQPGVENWHRNFVPPSLIQNRQSENVEVERDPPIPGDGLIEGTGSYLCILRGSEVGGEIFVRDVGIFRCNFENAQRIKTSIVGGVGYYQCNFQKPGQEQYVVQGVGWYVCLIGGAFRVRGIPENLKLFELKHYDSFFEVLGTVNGDFAAGTAIQGRVQLLGFYQIGPVGRDLDYGFVQALEGFKMTVQDTALAPVTATERKDPPTGALTTVDQIGTFHYSWKGTDVDNGRTQANHIIGSHIEREWGLHRLHLFISRYDYLGQWGIFGQNEDVIQVWGYYAYNFNLPTETSDPVEGTERKDKDKGSSSISMNLLEGMIVSEYNLELNIIDFIQLIGQVGWGFTGPDKGVGSLTLIGVYQTNSEKSLTGKITDLFVFMFQIFYSLVNTQREGETGFFQIYAIYNYYIELVEERAGWIQCAVQYSRAFQGNAGSWWNPEGTLFTVQVWGAYEINFPEISFTNGFYEVILSYAIDLSFFFPKDDDEDGKREKFGVRTKEDWGKGGSPGVLTFSVLRRCYVFGVAEKSIWVCYYQSYVLYTVVLDTERTDGRLGGQEVRLLAQYFQEVRNDNANNAKLE